MDDDERLQRLRSLTLEQRAILPLLCRQQSRRAIAERRSMTVAGVDYHCSQIARKLGLQEGVGRRNPVEFRLALLEFLPFLPQLDAEPSSPAADAEDEAAGQPDATPPADPAVLALVDQISAPVLRRPAELVPWSPPNRADGAGGAGPTARQALRRWWQPLAVLLVLALAAGVAGGAVTAHVVGTAPSVTAAIVSTSTGISPTLALAVTTATPSTTAPSTMEPAPQRTRTSVSSIAFVTSVSSAPMPAPPHAASAPAKAVPATVNPAATPLDLAGTVANTLPGTPLRVGQPVTSVLDAATKPHDLYALDLRAGTQLTVSLQASASALSATFGPDGILPEIERGNLGLCNADPNCVTTIPIPADGRYLLLLNAYGHGLRYTLRTSVAPLAVPPGATDLAGHVASTPPGTPLVLGTTVASVVDERAKPRDVYALSLRAGQTLQVAVDAASYDDMVDLVPPGGALDSFAAQTVCSSTSACRRAVPIATSGTYALVVEAVDPAVRYTLQATAQ